MRFKVLCKGFSALRTSASGAVFSRYRFGWTRWSWISCLMMILCSDLLSCMSCSAARAGWLRSAGKSSKTSSHAEGDRHSQTPVRLTYSSSSIAGVAFCSASLSSPQEAESSESGSLVTSAGPASSKVSSSCPMLNQRTRLCELYIPSRLKYSKTILRRASSQSTDLSKRTVGILVDNFS